MAKREREREREPISFETDRRHPREHQRASVEAKMLARLNPERHALEDLHLCHIGILGVSKNQGPNVDPKL